MRINQIDKQVHSKSYQKSNVQSKASNPLLKTDSANDCFQSAESVSNINRRLMNSKNTTSFGTKYKYTFKKSEITVEDIPSDCSQVVCHNITLWGHQNLDRIETSYKIVENLFSSPDHYRGSVALKENVFVNEIITASSGASLFDNSKANYIQGPYVSLYNYAEVQNVKCESLELSSDSKVTGIAEFKNKCELSLNGRDVNDFPYINPFLIKTGDGKFNPNSLVFKIDYLEKKIYPYMPETVYFDSNYTFIKDYKAKNVESKASLEFSDQSSAQDVVARHSVDMKNDSKLNSIKAEYADIKNSASVNSIEAKDVVLYDKAKAGIINATNVVTVYNFAQALKIIAPLTIAESNSKIDTIISDEVRLFNNAQVKSIQSSNISVEGDSKADNIISGKDIFLNGSGTIKNIQIKGNKITIVGPIKLTGKIKFDTAGEVVVVKDKNNKMAKISPEQIENGKIGYETKTAKGEPVNLDYKTLFLSSLAMTLSEINKQDEKQKLGEYRDLESIKKLYSEKSPKGVKYLDILLPNEKDKIQAEELYDNFAQNALLTLVNSGKDKSFTEFWVKNKTIGNQNLTDFWLTSLDIDIKGKNTKEKTQMLNDLSKDQRKQLVSKTVVFWVKNSLPTEMDKVNKNDLKFLQLNGSEISAVDEIKKGRNQEFKQIVKNEGPEKFALIQYGSKSLLDFWIDAVDGEGSAKEYSLPMKKDRLLEIVNSDVELEKLYKSTLEETGKVSTQVSNVKSAYAKLIENSELSEKSKEILEAYQNNQLFFNIVNGNAKNTNSIVSLQKSTQDILSQIEKERNKFIQDARKNIFEPIDDFKKLSKNAEKTDPEAQIALVFAILEDKIKNSPAIEANKTKKSLSSFNDSINRNDDNIELIWQDLLKQSQDYFENEMVKRGIETNIRQIFTIQGAQKDLPKPEIEIALSDMKLNLAQKDFIARYKEDSNLINLLKQPVNDLDRDLEHLIMGEQFNHSIFDAMSLNFRENMSLETIKSMPEEVISSYITTLGLDATKLNEEQKYNYILKIPQEELELAGKNVKKYWFNETLTKAMSGNIRDKVKKFDIGYNSAQAAENLAQINVKMGEQNNNLLYIATKIDHFIDTYKETQEVLNIKLDKMVESLEGIHFDTSNIKTNIKAMLFHSMKNTQDKILREEIQGLLEDSDKLEFSSFMKRIDDKQKEYKNSPEGKRKKYWNIAKKVIPVVVLVGAFFALPALAPFVATLGTNAVQIATFMKTAYAPILAYGGSAKLLGNASKVMRA